MVSVATTMTGMLGYFIEQWMNNGSSLEHHGRYLYNALKLQFQTLNHQTEEHENTCQLDDLLTEHNQ